MQWKVHQCPKLRSKVLQMACRHKGSPTMAIIIGFLVGLTAFQMQLAWAGTDSQCLLAFKNSVQDPNNKLSSWTTINATFESNVCYWQGVSCFSYLNGPVYTITLPNSGLSGTWPSGLNLCPSLQSLDLRGNYFTGPIPTTIGSDIPNLVYLNMSHNSLGGSIPAELSSCQFLNDLILDDNLLTGEIPASITHLSRLTVLSVANNQLSGPIPSNWSSHGHSLTDATTYAGNDGLCGEVLHRNCSLTDPNQSFISVPGFFVGIGIGFLIGMAFLARLWHPRLIYLLGRSARRKRQHGLFKHSRLLKLFHV